jgi:hypothetical protein
MRQLSSFPAGGLTGAIAEAGAMLVALPVLFPPPPGTDPVPQTAPEALLATLIGSAFGTRAPRW